MGVLRLSETLVLAKQSAGEITKLIHPNAVISIKLGKKAVSSRVAESVWGFFSIYVIVFILLFLFILAQGNDFITSFFCRWGYFKQSRSWLGGGLKQLPISIRLLKAWLVHGYALR